MKKEYMKPTMRVVLLRHRTMLLTGSPVKSVQTSGTGWDEEDNFLWGGGDNTNAR